MELFSIEYIDQQSTLERYMPAISSARSIAIDIETINWWSRDEERISIIQIAYRESDGIKVIICDLLSDLDPGLLRRPLEESLQVKVIHNASFDAIRIARHYGIRTSPVHDTMVAARRSGEKQCSLKAQVERHLGLQIEKTEQRSDWSLRPLSDDQMRYAALDAVTTLLLYESQVRRGIRGEYELKPGIGGPSTGSGASSSKTSTITPHSSTRVLLSTTPLAMALLQIIEEFPGRYSPLQLAASISGERAGIVGWMIDQKVGANVTIDADSILGEISTLIQSGHLSINDMGRLLATPGQI